MITKLKNSFLVLTVFFYVACSESKSEELVTEDPITGEEEKEEGIVEEEVLVLSEDDFFTSPSSFAVIKNLVTDYGADTVFSTDDSEILQTAINDISVKGGGKLIIPSGNFSFAEINMNSNVHIVVDDSAVFRPTDRSTQKNYAIFSFGNTGPTIENVSMTCSSGNQFKIDLTQTNNPNVTVFRLNRVNNFLLSCFEIDDVLTKFSAIATGIAEYDNNWYWPHNGVVKNAKTNNADYGYGLVQSQAGTNILFKDLDGTGGVTLRFETGLASMNDLQIGGLHDMFAENISCTDGNSALMVSPHSMHNGKVYINGVTSVSSGFAVRIDSGFISSKQTNPNLTVGTYEEVIVKNVSATFGSMDAQLKSKHYKYMPCDLRSQIESSPITSGGSSYNGPSIAGLLDSANFLTDVDDDDITAIGFVSGYELVTEDDAISDSNCN